jgi:hypothetical protein
VKASAERSRVNIFHETHARSAVAAVLGLARSDLGKANAQSFLAGGYAPVTIAIDCCDEGKRSLNNCGHGWTWFYVAPDASGRANGLPTRREPSEALRHHGEPFLEICAD